MNKPVLVYRLNTDTHWVGFDERSIEFTRWDNSIPVMHSASGEPMKAKISKEWWDIIYYKNFDGFSHFDVYVAVEPKLMEVLEAKHNLALDIQYNSMNNLVTKLQSDYNKQTDRIINFIKLPWYKRIWRAIRYDI